MPFQRTALARALVTQPHALLLDEPFAALDSALRQRLRDELNDLRTELNIPLLLITHDEEDVRCLADEVVHIEAGRIVGDGPTHHAVCSPRNPGIPGNLVRKAHEGPTRQATPAT